MDQKPSVTFLADIRVSGVVQGVGFRPFVARAARARGLSGCVRNEGGQVRIRAEGPRDALEAFVREIGQSPPPGSRINALEVRYAETGVPKDAAFAILASRERSEGALLPAPDIAVCEDCLRELRTPGDPRYANPFISCTNCGPRFSILRALPYDRPSTAMDAFPLCPLCAAQYADPGDRRCHAQTVCCNACGPALRFEAQDGTRIIGADAVGAAARALAAGGIVAVKGIGGYHFACMPSDEAAVQALRALKGRECKPFAVMFPDMDAVRANARVNAGEEALLRGPERPIVLLPRREGSCVAPGVCGASRYVGAFLPYTPLQHLLLALTGPLVMTSANRTGLPIIKDDEEMLSFSGLYGGLAGVLTHNREILRRLDDSVAAVVAGKPQMVRRGRGYVPLPIEVSAGDGRPLLACGAQQKSAVCLSSGGLLYPGAEMGDLSSLEAERAYRDAARDFTSILGVRPERLVCDLHPGYVSTRYAESLGLPVLKVQHHFAHIASVLAEHGLTEPVIGVAFDGTGYGTDGTVWGGEFLIASPRGFTRAGHLKSVPLLNSDDSIRHGWASAACLLHDAGRLDDAKDSRLALVKAALDRGINTIPSSSMGRVFDAVSSLLAICHESTYEGQCAIELENAAARCGDNGGAEPFPYDLRGDEAGFLVDLAPCVRLLCSLKEQGISTELLALRFHSTISRLILDGCLRLRKLHGIGTVALSGGVFQNRILLEAAASRLERAGFRVCVNRLVPPGDGGISLGQAYIGRFAGDN